jgi:hypothetical protein
MASLTWAMVTDAQGQVAEVLHVPNRTRKGKTGGRTLPLHPDLQAVLVTLQTARGDMATPARPILCSERGGRLSPAAVRLWFHRRSPSLQMNGCSSHSGRCTFKVIPIEACWASDAKRHRSFQHFCHNGLPGATSGFFSTVRQKAKMSSSTDVLVQPVTWGVVSWSEPGASSCGDAGPDADTQGQDNGDRALNPHP